MADKKFSDFTVQTDLSNFDGLVGFDGANNYKITPANLEANLNLDNFATGKLAIAQGGTNSTTAQAAIDALTNVSGATAGDVLTESGGSAVWSAPAAGGTLKWREVATAFAQFGTGTPSTYGPNLKGLFNFSNGRQSGFYQPYVIPYDCTLVKVEYYWNASALMSVDPGETAELRYLKYVSTSTPANDFGNTSDWTDSGSLGISFSDADGATRPFKSSTPSISFTAGEIIAVQNLETPGDTITPTTSDLTFMYFYFEAT